MTDGDEPLGGDPACWLDRVCPDCGRFLEEGVAHSCDVSPPGGERPDAGGEQSTAGP